MNLLKYGQAPPAGTNNMLRFSGCPCLSRCNVTYRQAFGDWYKSSRLPQWLGSQQKTERLTLAKGNESEGSAMPLKDYHCIWLAAHPVRTEEWLQAKLDEGFDIHHVDCTHDNNDPSNLVLIETEDHMRLHGIDLRRFIRDGRALRLADRAAVRAATDLRGAQAYHLKSSLLSWRDIGESRFPENLAPTAAARLAALRHAKLVGLPFPKPDANCPPRGKGWKNKKAALLHRMEPYGDGEK